MSQFLAEIEAYNQVIDAWIKAYYANGFFLIVAIASFIYIYINSESLRKKMLLPIFVMMLLSVNPILYKYVYSRIIYWRLIWMLPNVILTATAFVIWLKKQNKAWVKWATLCIFFAFVITSGSNVFVNGNFERRSNWEKLSQETIDVSDIILEYDESPKALVHSYIYTEVRQYAPEIKLLYGRDVDGYIAYLENSIRGVEIAADYDSPNYDYVLSHTKEWEVNFVVVRIDREVEKIYLDKYGYEEVGRTLGHIIYYNKEI